jgi:glycine cleavage system H protein
MNPKELKYTREHEWIRVEGDECTIGITDYAQEELGDVVFVELPDVGAAIFSDKPFGAVESVKAVSDLFAPVSGEVVAVNGDLDNAPETVNTETYGDGWMIRVKLSDPGEVDSLMDSAAYQKLVDELRS